jgi:hypothetical protein
VNEDHKLLIDEYIQNNNCKLEDSRKETINGEVIRIVAYKLPTELILYNIKNGRFKKEYRSLIKKNGGYLDPSNKIDRKKIQNLLLTLGNKNEELNPDSVRTYNDMEKKGQLELGIITQDGFLLDGNRRMSVLELLHEKTNNPKFQYIEVARIIGSISDKDMYRIEAGISLGMDSKVKYGPLNILLKIEEGLTLKYSESEISDMLYGDFTEDTINSMMVRLKLIRQYLKHFDNDEDDIELVEGKHEHFIELQNIVEIAKQSKSLSERQKIKTACFNLIKTGTSSDRLRIVKSALNNATNLDTLYGISEIKKEIVSDPTPESLTSPEFEEKKHVAQIEFENFEDEIRAERSSNSIPTTLQRILNNFKVLKIDEIDMADPPTKKFIEEILGWTEKLKNKI